MAGMNNSVADMWDTYVSGAGEKEDKARRVANAAAMVGLV